MINFFNPIFAVSTAY